MNKILKISIEKLLVLAGFVGGLFLFSGLVWAFTSVESGTVVNPDFTPQEGNVVMSEIAGPAGPAGPQGEEGLTGYKGDKGPKGDDGPDFLGIADCDWAGTAWWTHGWDDARQDQLGVNVTCTNNRVTDISWACSPNCQSEINP